MIGVIEQQKGYWQTKLEAIEKIVSFSESLSEIESEIFNICYGDDDKLLNLTLFYRKCAELEQEFNVIQYDKTAQRSLKDSKNNIYKIPLIFYSTLPSKPTTILEHRGYKFISKTPSPTPEAIQAMNSHKDKFNSLQIWWVPKDIVIEKIPNPDPILVGVISHEIANLKYQAYFELHRWIDELVEDGWWSQEGY